MLISWRRVNDFPQIDNTRNFTVKIIYYSNVFKYSNIRTFEFWSMYTVYIIYSIIRVNDMGRRFSSNCSNLFWKWKKTCINCASCRLQQIFIRFKWFYFILYPQIWKTSNYKRCVIVMFCIENGIVCRISTPKSQVIFYAIKWQLSKTWITGETRLSALIPTYKTQYSFSFSPYELLRLSMSTPGLLQFVQSQTQHLFWNSIMSIKKLFRKLTSVFMRAMAVGKTWNVNTALTIPKK